MGSKVFSDLYRYVKEQIEETDKSYQYARAMHAHALAVNYRVAKTCFEDILKVLDKLDREEEEG